MTLLRNPTSYDVARAPENPPKQHTKHHRFSLWHLFLLPTAILFAVPLVQMFLASFSPQAELLKFPPRSFPPTSPWTDSSGSSRPRMSCSGSATP